MGHTADVQCARSMTGGHDVFHDDAVPVHRHHGHGRRTSGTCLLEGSDEQIIRSDHEHLTTFHNPVVVEHETHTGRVRTMDAHPPDATSIGEFVPASSARQADIDRAGHAESHLLIPGGQALRVLGKKRCDIHRRQVRPQHVRELAR